MLAAENAPTLGAPLRVGILLESLIVPLWIWAVLEQLLASPLASIVLIIKAASVRRRPSAERKIAGAFYQAFCRFEEAYFRLDRDAYLETDVSALFANYDTVDLKLTPSGDYEECDTASIERIASYQLDLILKFGFRRVRGDILRVARFGVWEHAHSHTQTLIGGPPGFWEVFLDMPYTGASLKILGDEPHLDRTIDRCLGYTDKESVRRNRNNNAWRSSRFVMRALSKLHTHGANAITLWCSADDYVPYRADVRGVPGNLRMGVLLTTHFSRRLKRLLDDALYLSQWSVALKVVSTADEMTANMEGFLVLRPPRDRFWADPFVIRHDNRYFVFVEELFYSRPKGHISLLEFDSSARTVNSRVVLEEKCHLSYPFVFRYGDHIYMIPEMSESGRIQIYQATRFPYEWKPEAVLMDNVSAVDTTLVDGGTMWWMFTTMGADGPPKVDELHLFHAETPFGPWTPHPQNPVIADCRRGRQAGRVFSYRGQLYRPGQYSTKRGGYAVSINRILTLSPTTYREEPVDVIFPERYYNARGHHTLNSDGGMTVIDMLLKRSRWPFRKTGV